MSWRGQWSPRRGRSVRRLSTAIPWVTGKHCPQPEHCNADGPEPLSATLHAPETHVSAPRHRTQHRASRTVACILVVTADPAKVCPEAIPSSPDGTVLCIQSCDPTPTRSQPHGDGMLWVSDSVHRVRQPHVSRAVTESSRHTAPACPQEGRVDWLTNTPMQGAATGLIPAGRHLPSVRRSRPCRQAISAIPRVPRRPSAVASQLDHRLTHEKQYGPGSCPQYGPATFLNGRRNGPCGCAFGTLASPEPADLVLRMGLTSSIM